MFVTARQQLFFMTTLAAAFATADAFAKEFVVRPVTSFGGQPITPLAVPLAVAGDRLVLSATESSTLKRIFSTDGNSLQVISQTVSVPHNFIESGGVAVARLGNSVYFPGNESPNVVQLFATDGTSVRNLDGNLDPRQDFQLVNGNLVFEGASSQLYRFDGVTAKGFGIKTFALTVAGKDRVGDRLAFAAYPDGGSVRAYSTDGSTLSTIVDSAGQPLLGAQQFAALGSDLYFATIGFGEPAIYRTSDGLTAEKFATFKDFTFANSVESIFALRDKLYIQVSSGLNEWIFYQSSGGTPTELLSAPKPSLIGQVGNAPLFIDERRAYFQVGSGSKSLYAFDGDSFDLIDLGETYSTFEFIQLENRTFINAKRLQSAAMYELIDGNLVHIGPGLDSVALFDGELFGVNNDIPAGIATKTLFRTENGQLVPLDAFGSDLSISSRFVEFNGQLYFNGQVGFNRPQLFAVVQVPEPAMWSSIAAVYLAAMVAATRLRPSRH